MVFDSGTLSENFQGQYDRRGPHEVTNKCFGIFLITFFLIVRVSTMVQRWEGLLSLFIVLGGWIGPETHHCSFSEEN